MGTNWEDFWIVPTLECGNDKIRKIAAYSLIFMVFPFKFTKQRNRKEKSFCTTGYSQFLVFFANVFI